MSTAVALPPAPRHGRRWRFYSNAELVHRPLEHILEELPCRELGRALGIAHDTANLIKRGERQLEYGDAQRIREYLEASL